MAIQRAFIHVFGPSGAGKTTLIERFLEKKQVHASCARGEVVAGLQRIEESAPKNHPELLRYRTAGAGAAALHRFPEWLDDFEFYETALMREYSEAVFIEGDSPVEYVDLRVFVAPVPKEGESLFRRIKRNRAAERWALSERYKGLQHAQVVVVNVRPEDDRDLADALCADVSRLRSDPDVYNDILGFRGSRVQVTAVVADLSDAKDAGVRKCLRRIQRTVTRISEDY